MHTGGKPPQGGVFWRGKPKLMLATAGWPADDLP